MIHPVTDAFPQMTVPMHGFYGRILIVDLKKRRSRVEGVDRDLLIRFLGGKGLGSYLLSVLAPAGVDPLSPENPVIFATGPVCGTVVWGGSRYGVFSKSPQTGFYAESYSGGRIPEAMDAAGYDAVVLSGRSNAPVVVEIHPTGTGFHEAGDLWGMDTHRAEDEVLKRLPPPAGGRSKSGAVVVGPAGENGVCFSVIQNDYWRSAGRTGMGAVLGSKQVKALVFRGDRARGPADRSALTALAKAMARAGKTDPQVAAYKSKGTAMWMPLQRF